MKEVKQTDDGWGNAKPGMVSINKKFLVGCLCLGGLATAVFTGSPPKEEEAPEMTFPANIQDTPNTTDAVPPPITEAKKAAISEDERFLNHAETLLARLGVKDISGKLAANPDSEISQRLISTGRQACGKLDAGKSPQQVANEFAASVSPKTDREKLVFTLGFGAAMQAGVEVYCP